MNSTKEKCCTPEEKSLRTSRREFTKLLGSALFASASVAAARHFPSTADAKMENVSAVAKDGEIPVGGYKLFRYPTKDDPCILVRLAAERYAAFSQSCTHLTCPVHFQADKKQFYCPCHEGYFSAEDGGVLAGPPRRPLPMYSVEIREGEIWIGPRIRAKNA